TRRGRTTPQTSRSFACAICAGCSHWWEPDRVASDDAHVLGCLAPATRADVELDALTLFQGPVARALDGREVDEHVGSVLTGDEAVALLRVEPFHTACSQRLAPSILRFDVRLAVGKR